MVTEWISDFQAAHWQPDEDVVFDVLCGDFNFDNCSPGGFFFQKNVFLKKSFLLSWCELSEFAVFFLSSIFGSWRWREGAESLSLRAIQRSLQSGSRERKALGHRCGPLYFSSLIFSHFLPFFSFLTSLQQEMCERFLMMSLNEIFVFKGTLLEQPTLYEDDIITPENLQKYVKF